VAEYYPSLPAITPVINPLQLTLARNQMALSNATTPLDIAAAQESFQQKSALDPLILQQQRTRNSLEAAQAQTAQTTADTQSGLAPLTVQGATESAQANTTTFQNQQIGEVAQRARAYGDDVEGAAKAWDDGMQALVDKGIAGAGQYIGHYRPDFAQSLATAMGKPGVPGSNAPVGTGAVPEGTDTSAIQRSVATMPAPQVQTSLANINRAIDSFNKIADASVPGTAAEKWAAEIQALKAAGFPPQQLPPEQYSIDAYKRVKQQLDKLVPYRNALSERANLLATGIPQAAPPPLYKPGEPKVLPVLGPGGRPIAVSQDPNSGLPVFTQGPPGAQYRPPAALQTVEGKYNFAKNTLGLNDQAAQDFASGRRAISPQQIMQGAERQARQEYYDQFTSLARPDPPEGAQAWIDNRAKEVARQVSAAGGPQPAAAGGDKLSPADVQASIAAAKAAMAKRPDLKAQILQRLQAAGIPTQGL